MKKIKLNNKGLTVVELVVTFAILMVLVIGMLEVIINLKTIATDKALEKELIEFQSTMTQIIEDDLIKKKAIGITSCNTSNNKTLCYKINFEKSTSKELMINMNERIIQYDKINYVLPEKEIMEFRDSAVWANNTQEEKLKNNIRIEITSNNFLIIYIPFYIIDENDNHGLDIVYPIGL